MGGDTGNTCHRDDVESAVGSYIHSLPSKIDIKSFEKRLDHLCDDENHLEQLDDDTEILEIFPTSKPKERFQASPDGAGVASEIDDYEKDVRALLNELPSASGIIDPDSLSYGEFNQMQNAVGLTSGENGLHLQDCLQLGNGFTRLGGSCNSDEGMFMEIENGIDQDLSAIGCHLSSPQTLKDYPERSWWESSQCIAKLSTITIRASRVLENDRGDGSMQHDEMGGMGINRSMVNTTGIDNSFGGLESIRQAQQIPECSCALPQLQPYSLRLSRIKQPVPLDSSAGEEGDKMLAGTFIEARETSIVSTTLNGDSPHHNTCETVPGRALHSPRSSSLSINAFGFEKLRGALFGRDVEVSQLRQAFGRICRGSSEIIHVRGSSGSGKTQLVTRALQDFVSYQNKGHFVTGKFDQVRMNEPYSAVLKALGEWCMCIVRGCREHFLRVASILCEEDPDDFMILQQLIPPMENFSRESARCNDGNVSQLSFPRLKLLCCKLVQALSSGPPTVLYLDDMQWADASSRSLVQGFCSDMRSKNTLFVLACRDREYHTLRVDLLKNRVRSLETSTIVLRGLHDDSVTQMVSSALGLNEHTAEPVAKFLGERTNGNVHHLIRYVKRCIDDGALWRPNDMSEWSWDKSKTDEKPHRINDLLIQEIFTQHQDVQYIGSVAACIGYCFDIRLLVTCVKVFLDDSVDEVRIRNNVILACRQGFFVQESVHHYVFSHDSVQQCFYEIMEYLGGRDLFHLKIGEKLCEIIKTSPKASDAMIFLAVDHMNKCMNLISLDEKRQELARLNLLAGQAAIAKAAYDRACQYLRDGIRLLSTDTSWNDNYMLMYDLHKFLAFTSYCAQDFLESDAIVNKVIDRSATQADAIEAAYVMMQSLWARGEYEVGVAFTLEVLGMIQFSFSTAPTQTEIILEASRTRRLMCRSRDKFLLSSRPVHSPRLQAVMKILSFLALFSFHAERRQNVFSLSVFKMIQLTYSDGLVASSGNGLLWYGILQQKSGNSDAARKFCAMGSMLIQKMGVSLIEAPAIIVAITHVRFERKSLHEVYRNFKQAFATSLRFHDSRMTALAALAQISAAFYSGEVRLDQLEEEARFVVQYMRQTGCCQHLRIAQTILQSCICLQEKQKVSGKLLGDMIDGERATIEALQEGDNQGLECIIGMRLLLAISFEKWSIVQNILDFPFNTRTVYYSLWSSGFLIFERAIACLMQHERTRKHKYLREALKLKRSLQKFSERNHNACLQKLRLLNVEFSSLNPRGSPISLIKAYQKVTEIHATDKESLIDDAILNERAAYRLHENHDRTSAEQYVMLAIECYSKWGAFAKVKWLKSRFGDLRGSGVHHSFQESCQDSIFVCDTSSSDLSGSYQQSMGVKHKAMNHA